MSNWGPEGFARTSWKRTNLEDACRRLSPAAKQAFFAAAQQTTIARGTWDGCAFNAGANAIGVSGVASYGRAAQVFGMQEEDVRAFISAWDTFRAGSDGQATRSLIAILDSVGLFTSPVDSYAGQSFVKVLHENEDSVARREFDDIVSQLELNDDALAPELVQFKEAVVDAGELLSL